MTFYAKNGIDWNVVPDAAVHIERTLPAKNFIMKANPMTGSLYLQETEDFTMPTKIYGDTLAKASRIFNTFGDRSGSTGVLLVGEKGSGKTMLAKQLSIMAKDAGVATILINGAWCGEGFNQFLAGIDQPLVLLFDEFEKVYQDEDDQNKLLTLFDGTMTHKRLFLLTSNSKWDVSEFMRNRPGRIYYNLEFRGLGEQFIREYCADEMTNREHIEEMVGLSMTFDNFNFDMLKAIVEECNRYGEKPSEAIVMLNARPEYGSSTEYEVMSVTVDGEPVDLNTVDDLVHCINPMDSTWSMRWSPIEEETGLREALGQALGAAQQAGATVAKKKPAIHEMGGVQFNQDDLVRIDPKRGEFMFEKMGKLRHATEKREHMVRATLKKVERQFRNYFRAH